MPLFTIRVNSTCPQLARNIPRSCADNNLAGYGFLIGRDSSVGTATRCGLGGLGIESRWGKRFTAPFTGPGAHQGSPTMGTSASDIILRVLDYIVIIYFGISCTVFV
jgi:hypothetical protein